MLPVSVLKTALLTLFIASNSEAFGGVLRLLQTCPADKNEPWSYRGLNGPMFWGQTYPQCYGYNQSPIDIYPAEAELDENLDKLTLNNYDLPVATATIENNGHTIEVVPEDGVSRTISVNGDTYKLQQFHFHWGDIYYRGTEHVLDTVRYAMEMHLVHVNDEGKIAVVGVLFQEQDEENEELQKIVDELTELKYKGAEIELKTSLTLNDLLPANPATFYRYEGSLTTPGCSEGVTWSVIPALVPVGRTQMKEFRELYSTIEEDATDGCQLSGNYRPVQPLNRRQVYRSQ